MSEILKCTLSAEKGFLPVPQGRSSTVNELWWLNSKLCPPLSLSPQVGGTKLPDWPEVVRDSQQPRHCAMSVSALSPTGLLGSSSGLLQVVSLLCVVLLLLKAAQLYLLRQWLLRALQQFPSPPFHWLFGHNREVTGSGTGKGGQGGQGLSEHGHVSSRRTKPCCVRSMWPRGRAQSTPRVQAPHPMCWCSQPVRSSFLRQICGLFGRPGTLRTMAVPSRVPLLQAHRTELLDASLPVSAQFHPLCLALSLGTQTSVSWIPACGGSQPVGTIDRKLKKVSGHRKRGPPSQLC